MSEILACKHCFLMIVATESQFSYDEKKGIAAGPDQLYEIAEKHCVKTCALLELPLYIDF